MLSMLAQLSLFTAKALILVMMILLLLIGILSLFGRGKEKIRGHITIKNLNKKFADTREALLEEILSKDLFKKFLKDKKAQEKAKEKISKDSKPKKNLFVLNFDGDIKASAVSALREEVSAVLGIAKPQDEIVLRLESAGGMVHAYGLAASQLSRIREKNIQLTVIVDKVAASGGYLMACVANKIISAPFAIIGSIGVIVQLPNFHRLLKDKHIDFEQLTAGSYKRTLTMFGQNTDEGREKMRAEIEQIHHLFQNLILAHRPNLEMHKVATGEHWLGQQALELNLVDELSTSDDYLFRHSKNAEIFEIKFKVRKSFTEKLSSAVQMFKREHFSLI